MDTKQFLEATKGLIVDSRDQMPKHVTKVWRQRNVSEIQGLVLHQALSCARAEAVARYHVGPNHIDPNGLAGLSYTLFVERDGQIRLCNDIEATTFSQGDRTKPGDENCMYMSACFSGNFNAPGYVGSDEPTVEQMLSALALWKEVRDLFEWGNDDLFGHYHFDKSTCPGTRLQQLIEYVRTDTSIKRNQYDFAKMETRHSILGSLGYYKGDVNAPWGPASRTALAAFQKDHKLTVDGTWGPETERAISRSVKMPA